MALKPLQAGIENFGQFDGYDSDIFGVSPFKGGEVCSFTYVSTTGTDLIAQELDGYLGTTTKTRPAVTKNLVAGMRPLFLADEGTTGYGTLFGEVVGMVAGQKGSAPGTGTAVGPHTAAGSGKVTVWAKAGLYGVTLDAVDRTASTGLIPTSATLVGGDALYATALGLLTPNNLVAFDHSTDTVVARFIEFATNGSLVTTPASLVGTLASFTRVVIHWNGAY